MIGARGARGIRGTLMGGVAGNETEAIKELMRRVQILINKVAELERRMNNCKCGCCRKVRE